MGPRFLAGPSTLGLRKADQTLLPTFRRCRNLRAPLRGKLRDLCAKLQRKLTNLVKTINEMPAVKAWNAEKNPKLNWLS